MTTYRWLFFLIFICSILVSYKTREIDDLNKIRSVNLIKDQAEFEDVVFVIDVSSSMLAQDFKPNRIEAVKTKLKTVVKKKESNQQISFVLFAGETMILCPLTRDTNILLEQLEFVELNKMQDGTSIGNGLMYGLYEILKTGGKNKTIILLTDGTRNCGLYTPSIAAQLATQKGIQIYSFGIGSEGTAIGPVLRRTNGEYGYGMVTTKIDEKVLKSISDQTHGNYYRLTCNSDLDSLLNLENLLSQSKISFPIIDSLSFLTNYEIDSIFNEIRIDNALKYKQHFEGEE